MKPDNFRHNLKRAMKTRGLRAFELSEKSGIPQQNICMILQGRNLPGLRIIVKFLKALDCKFEELVK